MNALVWTPSRNDDLVLWYVVKHPPHTLSSLARLLSKSVGNLSQNVNKLRANGYLEDRRAEPKKGCLGSGKTLTPLPPALERVSWLERHAYQPGIGVQVIRVEQQIFADVDAQLARDFASVGLEYRPKSTEPRGSVEPPVDRLIDALASFQDELLQRANAQLRLRVSELEAEVAELRASRARCLERLAQAANAITD